MTQKEVVTTTKVEEVFFEYKAGSPLFRINTRSGAIRLTNSKGGVVVFPHKDHRFRFSEKGFYLCSGEIRHIEGKPAASFKPKALEFEFNEKGKEVEVGSGVRKLEAEDFKAKDLPPFKTPDLKRVGKGYFAEYGLKLSSPPSNFQYFQLGRAKW